QMISRLQTELGKTIGLRGLFVEPTVTGFAQTLTPQSRMAPRSNLVPVRRDGNSALCFWCTRRAERCNMLGIWHPGWTPTYRSTALQPMVFVAGEKALNTIPDIAAHYL
ncbi:amino acid adenylation, partial [Pseudomonas syringae pv. japonica str. M301072]